jgi:hypothetical protein
VDKHFIAAIGNSAKNVTRIVDDARLTLQRGSFDTLSNASLFLSKRKNTIPVLMISPCVHMLRHCMHRNETSERASARKQNELVGIREQLLLGILIAA